MKARIKEPPIKYKKIFIIQYFPRSWFPPMSTVHANIVYFLLDNPPATAPATAPIAFPTPGTAVPKIAPATPRLTLNFLFDVVMEILPHLGHDTIPAFLFALYCFWERQYVLYTLV